MAGDHPGILAASSDTGSASDLSGQRPIEVALSQGARRPERSVQIRPDRGPSVPVRLARLDRGPLIRDRPVLAPFRPAGRRAPLARGRRSLRGSAVDGARPRRRRV